MSRLFNWIKTNKLSAALILVVLYFFLSGFASPVGISNYFGSDTAYDRVESFAEPAGLRKSSSYLPPVSGGATPQLDISDRKVSTNSQMSLVVQNVNDSIKSIVSYAKSSGGYMVTSSQTAPEGLANGNVTIRVPSNALEDTMEFLRTSSVKVVSESTVGRDITDQYVDVGARLNTLEATKSRYEAILDKAVDIDEILQVTQQILYIQDQIDSLKGQLDYLDATSKSSLVTLYLSTDEFELPYSPDEPWRPEIVFKYAVREVVGTLRDVADFVIWIGVYAVIWVPVLLVILYIRKRNRQPPLSKS